MVAARTDKIFRMKREGNIFVVSAPSGAGKSSLCNALTEKVPGLKLSVSYTTRPPRDGEVNDVHYSFVSKNKFMALIDKGEFAEWAMVHGNLYGTSLKRMRKLNREGYDIILDIDVRGAEQLKGKCDSAVFIFILPPSMTVLRKRLKGRSTDSSETITRRMKNAKEEISHYNNYDFVVINDKFNKALHDIESIITSTGLRTDQADHKWIENICR